MADESLHDGPIKAAGGLVWRDSPSGKELAIIHRPGYGEWTLPKGKLNPGEDWQGAAVRVVKEKAGCNVKLAGFADVVSYEVDDVSKIVLYWNMILVGDCEFKPSEEVDQIDWLPVDKASERLNHISEQKLLLKASLGQESEEWDGSLRSKLERFLTKLNPESSAERTRLLGSITIFREEMEAFTPKKCGLDPQWAKSAYLLLDKAQDALVNLNYDLGWRYLSAARNMSHLGLDGSDRRAVANDILQEANEKLKSWRKKAIQERLQEKHELKAVPSDNDLFHASRILQEHQENNYYKIGALKRHLSIFIIIAIMTIIALIILPPPLSPNSEMIGDRELVLSVLLFGVLGAVFSGILSARQGTDVKIPEQKITYWIMFAKIVVGAVSALVISILISSGIIVPHGGANSVGVILAMSFAAGFTERLITRAIETVGQVDAKK